tara:strand:+ start:122 stop:784 length:663 start_codon:yes stop_codon:yes gene_type:complete
MAYINITGDSDGDLHTAALHNAKFGALASVLNGNVDHDNLKYPNSMVTWSISNGKGYVLESGAGSGTSYQDTCLLHATDSTIGNLGASNMIPASTAGAYNVLTNSYIKTPAALTHVSTSVVCINSSSFTSSAGMQLIFQTSDSLIGASGVYSNIATATFDPDTTAGSVVPTEITMSYSSNNIPVSKWFRVIYRNPTGSSLAGDVMPVFKITINWKTNTVA